jgi:secretion/DNA translocation related TadE-like protein
MMMLVLLTVTVAFSAAGAAVIARHRAQAGADLAALAGAALLPAGSAGACERATALAAAMRTTAVECRTDGLDLVVTVEVPVQFGRWTTGPARAAARAGPLSG